MSKPPETNAPKTRMPVAIWRTLSLSNMPNLIRIASHIHPSLPERDSVFAERVKLFPQGCLALTSKHDELCGYIISHPIRLRQPPALDSLLVEIGPDADQYYIHDVAILPEYQGRGLAKEGLKQVLGVAERFKSIGLVSVYSTSAFWGKFGFKEPVEVGGVMREKLLGYGDAAVYLEREGGGK